MNFISKNNAKHFQFSNYIHLAFTNLDYSYESLLKLINTILNFFIHLLNAISLTHIFIQDGFQLSYMFLKLTLILFVVFHNSIKLL